MKNVLVLLGRLFMAALFVPAGVHKIVGYAGTQVYMAAHGVPGALLPLVILLEIGGGLAVAVGWWSRTAAWALALFTLAAALIFHTDFSVPQQMTMFLLHLPIIGGFLLLAGCGPGALSVDGTGTRSAGD